MFVLFFSNSYIVFSSLFLHFISSYLSHFFFFLINLGTTSWKLLPEKNLFGLFKLRKNVWKEQNGFRYFKLVQTDRNGSGNDRLCIGGIEIFGTLNEDNNCPNGFLRSLGLFGLDSLYPKNVNHDQNNRILKIGSKDDENSDDESLISYSNPSVINGDNMSDNMSEYSTTSSNYNNNSSNRNSKKIISMPSVPKSIPGVLHFPAGFNSNYKINILPPRINNTGNNSTTMSQISENDNNQNNENINNNDDDYLGINEKKDSENNNNDDIYYNNKYESSSNKSAKCSAKSSNNGKGVLSVSENGNKDKVAFSAEINGSPLRKDRSSSPTISPLSTKNLEILQREYTN